MDRAKPLHSGRAIFWASALATILAPILAGVAGEIRESSVGTGPIVFPFIILFFAPHTYLILFGLTLGIGGLLSAWRLQNMAFYAVAGAVVAVITFLAIAKTSLGGDVIIVDQTAMAVYAVAGLINGVIYRIVVAAKDVKPIQPDSARLDEPGAV